MKSIIIVIGLLSSLASFAETVAIIKNPKFSETKMPISMKSDENGVCKYLGFELAVKGSIKKRTYTH